MSLFGVQNNSRLYLSMLLVVLLNISNYFVCPIYDLETVKDRTFGQLASQMLSQLLAKIWNTKFVSARKLKQEVICLMPWGPWSSRFTQKEKKKKHTGLQSYCCYW